MIKLVAFDLDGTIGDTIPMCLKALKKAVTPYVTLNDVSENDILETFGLNEKGMIKKLVGYNWENALDDFYVIYEQMHIMCVTRNFAASLFRNIKYFTLRKLYLCRKWMQKRLQKTTTTGITLPNFDFLA